MQFLLSVLVSFSECQVEKIDELKCDVCMLKLALVVNKLAATLNWPDKAVPRSKSTAIVKAHPGEPNYQV